jgi:soluble lytic murein transglycosylase
MKNALTLSLILTSLFVMNSSKALALAKQPTSTSLKIDRTIAEQRKERLGHAKELMGSSYRKSVVRSGEKIKKFNSAVFASTKQSLPAKHKSAANRVAKAIISEADRHGFDPVFLISVIQTESSFNPAQIGGVGEIGLMQLRPETAKWIADKIGVKWNGPQSLFDPVVNIRLGAAYLAYVRERFDSHAQLYLAAYNMGPTNVKRLRNQDKWPTEYPARVMGKYVDYYRNLKVSENSAANTTRKLAHN